MRLNLSVILQSLFFLLFITPVILGQDKTDINSQNEELGKVSWHRDYDQALKLAQKENKAVLILFQEVPGCSTCRNYGHNVLSHPLLVDAIENEFIPLAIFNNKGGKDREILKKYNEPSWNNPVVRIVDANGDNLVKRVAGNYSAKGLHKAIVEALTAEKKKIPDYIQILGEELALNSSSVKEKHYSMYCFWTGEGHFGKLDGVVSAEAGFVGYKEVVKVKYDSTKISEKELDAHASKGSCSKVENSRSYIASQKDHLYYLKNSNYKFLPLSELQKTKINSALGKRKSAVNLLSPKQKQWFNQLKTSQMKEPVLYNLELEIAWNKKIKDPT